MSDDKKIEIANKINNRVKDPRNIQTVEWLFIDDLMEECTVEEWEEVLSIAKGRNKNIIRGGGENARSSKAWSRKIGH